MKAEKGKARISAPVIVLLATALVLAFTMIGTAQAALDKKTNVYEANLTLSSLDVSLTENGEDRADGSTLLENLTAGEKFAFGKKYDEDLAAVNEGSQPEYVRVTINKYWLEPNGSVWTKDTSLSPAYSRLRISSPVGSVMAGSWPMARSPRRTILLASRSCSIA